VAREVEEIQASAAQKASATLEDAERHACDIKARAEAVAAEIRDAAVEQSTELARRSAAETGLLLEAARRERAETADILAVAEQEAAELVAKAEQEALRLADDAREMLAQARETKGTAERESASLLASAHDRASQTMAAAVRELDAAIALASTIPAASMGGAIEIRPLTEGY